MFLYAANDPVIESSKNVTFYPYNVTYPKLAEHCKAADLLIEENKWNLVFDFTPNKEGGLNYDIGEAKDWKLETIKLDGFDDPAEYVIPYPVKYGGTIPDDAKFGTEDENMKAFGIDDMKKGKHADVPAEPV